MRVPRTESVPRRALRKGSVLLEFALIAFLLYLILAATLEFGRALLGAQLVQQAADAAAREIARTPLPPGATLQQVLYSTEARFQTARSTIFDETLLEIPLADIQAAIGDAPTVEFFADKPILNRLLFPLMVVEGQGDARVLRYPGLIPNPDRSGSDDPRWVIPVNPYSGAATVYRPVVHEILAKANPTAADYSDPELSPFNLAASGVQPSSMRGVVALRLNYPFQAVTLSATRPQADPTAPNFELIDAPEAPPEGLINPYSGADRLGSHYAMGRPVRPFRRLISAQAIYRRELVSP